MLLTTTAQGSQRKIGLAGQSEVVEEVPNKVLEIRMSELPPLMLIVLRHLLLHLQLSLRLCLCLVPLAVAPWPQEAPVH